ncbi:hypothetical protein RJ640_008530 [Escallonia rubra]|uniref:Uncharacterized protein n=1 Tax=Escallonia rubra TaxID=112253 RepID=A0AA88R6Y4_9ASTE|nr:hypothetical protein RJ640_008530 [Escallonia rubra]
MVENSIKWEERLDKAGNIHGLEDISHGELVSGSMIKLGSSIVAIYEESGGVIIVAAPYSHRFSPAEVTLVHVEARRTACRIISEQDALLQ